MQVRHDRVLVFVARKDESGISHDFLQLHRAGAWHAISGLIEGAEQAWQTALRLLKRDTDLIPRELYRADRIHTYYSPSDDAIFLCPQFLAVIDGFPKVVHSGDYDESRWVARKHLATQFPLPSQHATLTEFCAEILDDGPARDLLRIPIPTPGGGNGKH